MHCWAGGVSSLNHVEYRRTFSMGDRGVLTPGNESFPDHLNRLAFDETALFPQGYGFDWRPRRMQPPKRTNLSVARDVIKCGLSVSRILTTHNVSGVITFEHLSPKLYTYLRSKLLVVKRQTNSQSPRQTRYASGRSLHETWGPRGATATTSQGFLLPTIHYSPP